MNTAPRFTLILATFLISLPTWALTEISLNGSFKKDTINTENYQISQSLTASMAFYIWEMSAIEISHTNGLERISTKPAGSSQMIIDTIIEMTGADFVLSFGTRKDAFIPYLKFGAAYLQKRFVRYAEGQGTNELEGRKGIVPSAGLGCKMQLTEVFSLKFGIDGWTNEADGTVDYAYRMGLSWFM